METNQTKENIVESIPTNTINKKVVLSALGAIVLLGVLWIVSSYLVNREAVDTDNPLLQTGYSQAINGVEGIVNDVDFENMTLSIDRVILVEKDGARMQERSTFTFKWLENTRFLYYRGAEDVRTNTAVSIQDSYQEFLKPNINVVILPQEVPDTNKTLTATEIRIMPGVARVTE